MDFDVIIVGGGPAGLSAALMLGRCRRRVLVCDAGTPRNAASQGVHGLLSRDGIVPRELLRLAREEVQRYGVEIRLARVVETASEAGAFVVTLDSGERLCSRLLLLATGVVDRLPEIDGARACFGRTLFHCPYCDGWEVRDRRLAVYARNSRGLGLALSLLTWSRDVVLCTDGPARLAPSARTRLEQNGVRVREERVAALAHRDGWLERVVFEEGPGEDRDAMFFNTGQYQRSDLAARLGCSFTQKGVVRTDGLGATRVPGVYAAGDASKDVQWVTVAAAEGAKVAYAMNRVLQQESLK